LRASQLEGLQSRISAVSNSQNTKASYLNKQFWTYFQ